ncbi:GRN protein, partial [Alopecoenas beccarii]|nr:GRN protein [Alopecoenas beccarii]
PQDVPCAGRHRCCPQGSRCSADGESCVTSAGTRGSHRVGGTRVGLRRGTRGAPRAVPCPDGQSECPDNATCCVTTSGAWGCCPMPQASCCADRVHCCPHGTVCDLAHGRCLSPAGDTPLGTAFPAWKRQPPPAVTLRQVLCPDGRSACPDGATCCQLSPGQYGCCPLQNVSAGPPGTDTLQAGMGRGQGTVALELGGWGHSLSPGGPQVFSWRGGSAWTHPPLFRPPQAVCCPDHVHCCPQGYTCDTGTGTCLQDGGPPRPWAHKSPALARGGDVKCDEETSCPQGSTCCPLSLGTWGCCP